MDRFKEYICNNFKNVAEAVLLFVVTIFLIFFTHYIQYEYVPSVPGAKTGEELVKSDFFEETLSGDKANACVIEIGDYSVQMETGEDVVEVLDNILAKFDLEGKFQVVYDVTDNKQAKSARAFVTGIEGQSNLMSIVSLSGAGVGAGMNTKEELPDGIAGISFEQEVFVYPVKETDPKYTKVQTAVEDITKEKEECTTYTVQPGDCVSLIAEDLNMETAKLCELNNLDPDAPYIFVGDDLIVTIPEPELSVLVNTISTYEEEYQADTIYIDNENWYDDEEEILDEGYSGRRIAQATIISRNGREKERTLLSQVILQESKSYTIERGTLIRPTYIKPLYGGTFSSGFGPRWGTTHKGVDWATPTGTTVFASCGGTVSLAGWNGGYGNVVYINHPDGRQTRYAHNSEVLVDVGDVVEQGDAIAISGSTGDSTGPHVHFEILIGGVQVDPLEYLY